MRFGVNINLFLGNQNFAADGAVATLGLAGRVAGRRHSSIRHRCMLAGRRNLFHAVEGFSADRASHALGIASFRAGGSFRVHNFFRMLASGRQHLFFCVVAAAALQRHTAVFGAGRRNKGLLVLDQLMPQRSAGNFDHLATGSAANTADQTGLRILRAGGVHIALLVFMLASGGNDFGLGLAAFFSLAGVSLFTSCAAGGRRRNFALIPAVTQRGDFFRLGLLAHSAGVSHLTCFGAGGRLAFLAITPLVFSSNHLILAGFAVRANILADTRRGAGGRLQRRSQHVVVRFGVGRNHSGLLQNCFAHGADAAAGGAGSRTGSGNFLHRYRSMAGGRSQFAQISTLKDFTTDRTLHNALAVLRAGRLYHLGLARRMAGGRQHLFLCVVAAFARAFQRHAASLGAGRRNKGLLVLDQIMPQRSAGYFDHLAICSAADSADPASLGILGAGSLYQLLLKVMLAGGFNDFGLSFFASRAGIQRLAGFAAGGCLICFRKLPLVASRDGHIVVVRRICRIGILHDSVGRAGGSFDYRYGICSLILINRNGAAAGTNDSHTVGNLAGLDGASLHLNGSSRSGVLNQLRQCLRGTNIVLGAARVRHGNGAAAIFHVILHTGAERAARDGNSCFIISRHINRTIKGTTFNVQGVLVVVIASMGNLDLAVDHTAARHGDSHITILLEAAVDVKGHIALLGDDGGVLDHDVAAVVGHRICAVRSGHTTAVDDHTIQRQVAIVLEYHSNPGISGIHGAAFHRDLAARE